MKQHWIQSLGDKTFKSRHPQKSSDLCVFLEKELMAVFQILNYVHHPKQVKKYQLECRDRKLTPPPLPPLPQTQGKALGTATLESN